MLGYISRHLGSNWVPLYDTESSPLLIVQITHKETEILHFTIFNFGFIHKCSPLVDIAGHCDTTVLRYLTNSGATVLCCAVKIFPFPRLDIAGYQCPAISSEQWRHCSVLWGFFFFPDFLYAMFYLYKICEFEEVLFCGSSIYPQNVYYPNSYCH